MCKRERQLWREHPVYFISVWAGADPAKVSLKSQFSRGLALRSFIKCKAFPWTVLWIYEVDPRYVYNGVLLAVFRIYEVDRKCISSFL